MQLHAPHEGCLSSLETRSPARRRLAWPCESVGVKAAAITLIAVAFSVATAAAAEAGAAADYVKRSTWHETMVASREAMIRSEAAGGVARLKTFASPILRGGERALQIDVPVAGVKELYLYVVGAPDVIYGAATWADPKLIDGDGRETRLEHIKGLQLLAGRDAIDCNLKSGVSGPLRIAGQEFQHGVHVYAPASLRVPLDRPYQRLTASIGIDDWVGRHGEVRFFVTDAAGAARLDLWTRVALDFSDGPSRWQLKWTRKDRILEADWTPGDLAELAQRYVRACHRVPGLARQAAALAAGVRDAEGLAAVRQLYYRSRELDAVLTRARSLPLRSLRMAIDDLTTTFAARYPGSGDFHQRLAEIEASLPEALAAVDRRKPATLEQVASLVERFDALQREALLANPLLDFDKLLLIRRVPHGDPRRALGRGYGVGEYIGLPRQSSKSNPNIEQPRSWDNEIGVLSPVRPDGKLTTLYQSSGRRLITDLDLHWDADRLLFSMPGSHDHWHVFELPVEDGTPKQLTPTDQPDVHYYDSCYLPNGQIAFVSTAPFQGVPCNAGVIVGMMYLMDADGKNIHQVCFEQDHTYCPTVLNDGRVLYLRWDYTDTPHVWNRILFSMNPDGTDQMEYYGSNSYWPNAIFYARPIPQHPSKVAGVVTGHHVGRAGELVIFDPAKGRRETEGVVQRLPGYGKPVEPLIEDKLTEHSWPKFLHPYPLNEKYFIVSCKPTPDSLWGIYLIDVFDNMVLLKEDEGHVLVEPIPLRKTKRPPVIPSRIDPNRNDALVYMTDVYSGPGLAGVPRGAVKQLRIFTYHFGYQRLAGIDDRVGTDGPWEVKRVLGTVPVEADGSALFHVPAKTPISVQPLDAEGKALQLMRSWMTALPGETLSCVGCHESRNSAPAVAGTLAIRRGPSEITPWHGPPRGFSFNNEVQPVLDKYCVGCHDGSLSDDSKAIPDLRRAQEQDAHFVYKLGDPELKRIEGVPLEQLIGKYKGIFPPSYIALRRLVRVGGLESDLHALPPKEFHADTSELIQMLRKGHHNVQLDGEAWDRLVTWIDLNAPCHGTWGEFVRVTGNQCQRRQELQALYGGVARDAETYPQAPPAKVEPIMPPPEPAVTSNSVDCPEWPFDAAEARRRQKADGPASRWLELGGGVRMELRRVPAGHFVMGDPAGCADERPATAVAVERPFWIGRCEVTNQQFAQFDQAHDSRFEHRSSWIFSEEYLGWPLNRSRQPVVRISWDEAMAFCRWLSARTGLHVTLPTEAQWEYACRAGTASPLSYGDLDTDFRRYGNMADVTMRDLAYQGWRPKPPDVVARDGRFDDGALVTADVGSYAPNPWGICDMHGNVGEWTRSQYQPYPYHRDDGRNSLTATGPRVVRGGSWYDRPKRCRSAFRIAYPAWQKVYNVGFRVVAEEPRRDVAASRGTRRRSRVSAAASVVISGKP